jgi:hypothetical protein
MRVQEPSPRVPQRAQVDIRYACLQSVEFRPGRLIVSMNASAFDKRCSELRHDKIQCTYDVSMT